MPHRRTRHILNLILKRAALWPVLGILGPRQVGKSTLLRDILSPRLKAKYLTLDRIEVRDRADKAPSRFLRNLMDTEARGGQRQGTLILDEVQKSPDLFDAIKAEVDEHRRPGRFLLSGSTEFSKKTGIRESLTGRIGILRLYPLTLAELHNRKPAIPWVTGRHLAPHGMRPHQAEPLTTDREIQSWLERGGMPGICFLRNQDERSAAIESWIDVTCFRDLQQIKGGNLNGETAREILQTLATLEHPVVSEISARTRLDGRVVSRYLDAFRALFVVQQVEPHPLGVGKPEYLIVDSAIAGYLGAPEPMRLRVLMLNECLAQHELSGKPRPRVRYYTSSKRSRMDFVIETTYGSPAPPHAFLLSDEESLGTYEMRAAHAFLKKAPDAKVTVLAPVREAYKESKSIMVVPWTAMG